MNTKLFTSFPVLNTTRLRLDQIELADEEEIFALRSDAHNRRYIDAPLAKNKEEAIRFIEKIRKGVAEKQWLYWGVRLQESGPLMGSVCLWNFSDDQQKAEIGYELLPAHQGQGYMREIVQAVISYSFETLKLESISAYTHHENEKSRQLLEKCNFEQVEMIEESHAEKDEIVKMAVYQVRRSGGGGKG